MLVVIVFILLLIVAFVLYRKYSKSDVLSLRKHKTLKGEVVDVGKMHPSSIKEKGVMVRIDDFLEEFIVGDSIPEPVLMELQLKRLAGEEQALVSQKLMDKVKERCANYWKAETKRAACLTMEDKARDWEEQGETDRAIEIYEKNVESGYPAFRSYDRLVALYEERGESMKKIEVLRKAVVAFGEQHPILREICELKLEQAESAFGKH